MLERHSKTPAPIPRFLLVGLSELASGIFLKGLSASITSAH